MSEQSGQSGQPQIDISVSNLDVPRDQLRDTLIQAIDRQLEQEGTQEMIDVHVKGDVHYKS
jgi:hypothetical protein